MKVLIIKTSSMGDIIHTLPALTDASHAIPSISFDWVVEENFAEIPKWHPRVDRVIPVAVRRWRKNLFAKRTRTEWKAFRNAVQSQQYDLIIDAQGLVKSAFLSLFARGIRCGGDWHSAREPWASLFYQRKYPFDRNQHAVQRVRRLFSQALNYPLLSEVPEYGIDRRQFLKNPSDEKYLVFLHGTTWKTKHWPEEYWIQLARIANKNGYGVKVTWGNSTEKERAERIAAACDHVTVLDKLDLLGVAAVLAGAQGVAAVDTGLCHLAAALDVPTVSLYGPTNPVLTGALGKSQIHLSADFPCAPCLSRECTYPKPHVVFPPCFQTVSPERVWGAILSLITC